MADVRAGTGKIQDKPGIFCSGRKKCSKIITGQGGIGETHGLSKKHWNQLDEAPTGQT